MKSPKYSIFNLFVVLNVRNDIKTNCLEQWFQGRSNKYAQNFSQEKQNMDTIITVWMNLYDMSPFVT